jgi:WD40 repeat protein
MKRLSCPLIVACCALFARSSGSDPASPQREIATLPPVAQRANFNANAVAFSPDGKFLLAYGVNEIQFWDTSKWKLMRKIVGKKIGPPLALSPDGKTLTASAANYRMQVWDVQAGKLLRNLPGFRKNVAFSPNGSLMAGNGVMPNGGADTSLHVWNALTGARIRTFPNPRHKERFSFSPDNRLIASAGAQIHEDTVEIWNLATGRLVSSTRGQGHVEAPVVFSPDGKTFATAGFDPNWQLPSEGPDGPCCSDGGVFVDYVAKLWNIRTGKISRIFKGWTSLSNPYTPLGFVAQGNKLLYRLGNDHYSSEVEVLDAATGRKLAKIKSKTEGNFRLSPDGKTLVYDGATLTVWTLQ